MSKKDARQDAAGQTPATQWLKAHGVAFTEHPYAYLEHGGAGLTVAGQVLHSA